MAVFAEIPCALICFYVSRRITKLFEQAKDYLNAAGFTVRDGHLVPPEDFRRCPSPPPDWWPRSPSPRTPQGPNPLLRRGPGPVLVVSKSSERGLGGPVGQQGLLAEQL